MTREEQRTELLVHRIKDNCFEVAKKLLEEHDKQIKEDAIDELVTEAIEKYETYDCKICKRKDEEACTFGDCTIAFLEQLKERKE